MSEFEQYLFDKKIDAVAFKAQEPERWQEWHELFMLTHPRSFTAQKLFLINKIRLKYHLKEQIK